MVNAAGLRERSLPSDFTDRLPGGVSQHSSQPTKWNSDGSGSVSGLTGHAGETAGDTKPAVESAEQIASGPRDLLNVSLSSGLGNEKQIASAEDGPSTPVRARANSEISIETVTKGQTPTHPRLQGQEMRAIEVPATGLGLNRSSANTTCDISQSSQSLAMAQGAGKPGQGITARASAEDQLRVAQAAKTSQPVRQGHLPPVGQSGNSAPDGSTMPRDPAGSLGTGNTVGNFAGASSGTTPSAASRETFAALDAETASGTPTWIHAGTHRAEAGFNDPALGWISVRADMSGGGIHAALVSGSTDAAQALGGHISGLNAYLAEIHTLVKSLTIAAPGNLDGGSGTNSNASQSMYSGNGEGMGQDTGNGAQAAPQSSGETGSPAMTLATIAARSVPQDATALPHTPEGVHISVMA